MVRSLTRGCRAAHGHVTASRSTARFGGIQLNACLFGASGRRGYASKDKPDRGNDLFLKLFPDTNQRGNKHQSNAQQDSSDTGAARTRSANARPHDQSSQVGAINHDPLQGSQKTPLKTGTGVLILESASKSLDKEDFLRLVPRGANTDAWVAEQEMIQQVIAGRHPETLERDSRYYIIFKTAAAAKVWRTRAERIAALQRLHGGGALGLTITDEVSALLEPGEDPNELLRMYSLSPPGQLPDIKMIKGPPNHSLMNMIESRGLPIVTRRSQRSPVEVVFRTGWDELHLKTVQRLISRSARVLGMQWNSAHERTPVAIWRPSIPKTGYKRPEQVKSGKDFVPLNKDERAAFAAIPSRTATKPEIESTRDNAATPTPANMWSAVFIVGFQYIDEATAFVHYWHRRPIANPRGSSDNPTIYIDAEVLW